MAAVTPIDARPRRRVFHLKPERRFAPKDHFALREWFVRMMRRRAAAGEGIAYTQPVVGVENDPSRRAETVYVSWLEAAIPSQPGSLYVLPKSYMGLMPVKS